MSKNLSVIGIGRLGLCFSLSLEKAGYDVIGCDINKEYVDSINEKSFFSHEPGVNDLLSSAKTFFATTSLQKTIEHSRINFVTVASFTNKDGSYDVSQVESVVDSLCELGIQQDKKHLVICTNVNPGYADSVYQRLREFNWDVSFNPETIAQGTILKNQAEPDCIYIGSDSQALADEICQIYKNVCQNNPSIHTMDRLSAELTKLSLNCFLTSKISFANMVGDLAVKIGADPDKILSAVGSDSRINNKFFRYGFGWGGPCFPRDIRAYNRLSQDFNMPYNMCQASNKINNLHLDFQVKNFLESEKKEYFTDCVTYKKGTTIIEESQQLKFALRLAENGVKVKISEHPIVVEKLKEIYGDLFEYE